MTSYYLILSIWLFSILLAPALFVVGWKLRKKEYYFLAHVFFLLTIVYAYARFIEPSLLVVRDNYVDLRHDQAQDQRRIRIALLADAHIGLYRGRDSLVKIVDRINQERPDIVILPGDFIYGTKFAEIKKNLAPLKNLKYPAYAVLGNHDESDEGGFLTEEVKSALDESGIILMDNRRQRFRINGHDIVIAGLDDYLNGNPDYRIIDNIIKDDFSIVLAHNPDSVYSMSADKADLLLSGHTHGGQVRIPFLYKHVIPSEYGFDRGWYDINGTKVFVTAGIGMVGLPLRFLNPPVIDMIEADF